VSFEPEDFRRLAASMLQKQCGPAECRTAVGRCYYALFLHARRAFDPLFHFSPAAEAHKEIWTALNNCRAADAREIAAKLDDLRRSRNQADYDWNDPEVGKQSFARLKEIDSRKALVKLKGLLEPGQSDVFFRDLKSGAAASGKPRLKA
jgi:hypothetical protein